jgi:hypothetical protein
VERGVRKRANLAYDLLLLYVLDSPTLTCFDECCVVLYEHLLDVVNNNSKFPVVEKKHSIKERSVPNLLEKKRKENLKTINSRLIFQKTQRACNFHQKNRQIFTCVWIGFFHYFKYIFEEYCNTFTIPASSWAIFFSFLNFVINF